MSDLLIMIAVVAVWLVLQMVILPRFGVPT